MTRDEYNNKVAEILCHKKRLQPKSTKRKHFQHRSNPRNSAIAYGKHDKVSTRSSKGSIKVSNVQKNAMVHKKPKLVHKNPKPVHKNLELFPKPHN